MRVMRAIMIAVLAVALIAGCGGGSTSTGAASHDAAGSEEGFLEVGGPGPPPADGGAPLRGARLRAAEARRVSEGEMVVGEEGWVRSAVGDFWTPDGGRSWRSITPPGPEGAEVHGFYFADARRGWGIYEPGREGDARPSIYMTRDGGRTWHHTRLRGYDKSVMPASEVSFSLVDGHELFALVRASGDTASNFGSLFVSRDEGRHWRALPTPPQAGQISFETPRRGWLAGAFPGPALSRTIDGGRTWIQVEPGKPLDSQPPQRGEYFGPTRLVAYTVPLIGPGGHGILGTDESAAEGIEETASRTTVWRTDDYGRSWHRSDRIDLPNAKGRYEAGQIFTRRGSSRSFLVHDPGGDAYTVVGPDGRAGPLRPIRGLPHSSSGFSFSDTRHGFAFPSFSNGFTLSFTEDGGRSWIQVPVPRAP